MGGLMKSLLALMLMLATMAQAQQWPSKPVKLVAPFGAGSVLDTMMRAMQNELTAALGQPVIIESRPGAGGAVGTAAVAKSPADEIGRAHV